jgi:hypothetical protein
VDLFSEEAEMKPQTATPTKRESLLSRIARLLGFKRRPVPQAIDGNPTDKKTDPWGGPPPM